jgi:UPF0042 nucleotide-binding protein
MNKSKLQLLIITGFSGAGKSTATHFYEDAGYFCMDNVPPILLPQIIEVCLKSNDSLDKLAVVIDARGGSFLQDLASSIEQIKKNNIEVRTLFLEASETVLVRRFSETRRRHPLSKGGRINDDIAQERKILAPIKDKADFRIDTSKLTSRELQSVLAQVSEDSIMPRSMSVVFVSFGFKHGVPIDCDLIFDVRFLTNPFYVPELKKLTGQDKPVKDFIFSTELANDYLEKLINFIEFQIPSFVKEPKARLQIGIGCTGGKHRSVAFVEALYAKIESDNIKKFKIHRDITKN